MLFSARMSASAVGLGAVARQEQSPWRLVVRHYLDLQSTQNNSLYDTLYLGNKGYYVGFFGGLGKSRTVVSNTLGAPCLNAFGMVF